MEDIKITDEIIGDGIIFIYLTDNIGRCELGNCEWFINYLNHMYDISIDFSGKILYFHYLRIVDKYQCCGYGSMLMNRLIKILDERRSGVIVELSPYDGSEKFEDLVRFYKRFGFEFVDEKLNNLMFRYPTTS